MDTKRKYTRAHTHTPPTHPFARWELEGGQNITVYTSTPFPDAGILSRFFSLQIHINTHTHTLAPTIHKDIVYNTYIHVHWFLLSFFCCHIKVKERRAVLCCATPHRAQPYAFCRWQFNGVS